MHCSPVCFTSVLWCSLVRVFHCEKGKGVHPPAQCAGNVFLWYPPPLVQATPMPKQHQALVPSIFAPLFLAAFFNLFCGVPRVLPDPLALRSTKFSFLRQGSPVGQEGICSVFCLLGLRVVHRVDTCITQVAAGKQRPCPSDTGRWSRQVLVIYRCLDKGRGGYGAARGCVHRRPPGHMARVVFKALSKPHLPATRQSIAGSRARAGGYWSAVAIRRHLSSVLADPSASPPKSVSPSVLPPPPRVFRQKSNAAGAPAGEKETEVPPKAWPVAQPPPPNLAAEFGRICRIGLPNCWVSESRRFVLPNH